MKLQVATFNEKSIVFIVIYILKTHNCQFKLYIPIKSSIDCKFITLVLACFSFYKIKKMKGNYTNQLRFYTKK